MSDDERKRKALLAALMPSGENDSEREWTRSSENRHLGGQHQHTEKGKISLFEQVDAVLGTKKNQQQKQQKHEDSISLKWKLHSVAKDNDVGKEKSQTPRKWTSYLPLSSSAPSTDRSLNQKLENYNERSIFDVFKIPLAPPPRSPQAFDLDSYNEFCELLEKSLKKVDANADMQFITAAANISKEKKDKVLDWIRAEECLVPTQLELLQSSLTESMIVTCPAKFVSELKQQAQSFQNHMNLEDNQYNFAMQVLRRILTLCVDEHRALAIPVIWNKLKEAGNLDKTTIDLVLKGCTTFSASILSRNSNLPGSHDFLTHEAGTRELVDNIQQKKSVQVPVPEQVATAHDLLCDPTNQTISIRVRKLLNKRDSQGALDVIEKHMVCALWNVSNSNLRSRI